MWGLKPTVVRMLDRAPGRVARIQAVSSGITHCLSLSSRKLSLPEKPLLAWTLTIVISSWRAELGCQKLAGPIPSHGLDTTRVRDKLLELSSCKSG